MMILDEIEIGPHFLTLYSKQYHEMLEAAKRTYEWFINAYPSLAKYQQKDLAHEDNDPKVYHPYGEPNHFRKGFRHFHIRYGFEGPTEEHIKDLLNNLPQLRIIKSDDFKITRLEDHIKNNTVYESALIDEDYLAYINRIKTK